MACVARNKDAPRTLQSCEAAFALAAVSVEVVVSVPGLLAVAFEPAARQRQRQGWLDPRAANVRIVTFNSGIDQANLVGSGLHIEVDNHQGGVLGGRRFAEADVTGTLLCVIHEEHNVSLEQRRANFEGVVDDFEQGD